MFELIMGFFVLCFVCVMLYEIVDEIRAHKSLMVYRKECLSVNKFYMEFIEMMEKMQKGRA